MIGPEYPKTGVFCSMGHMLCHVEETPNEQHRYDIGAFLQKSQIITNHQI